MPQCGPQAECDHSLTVCDAACFARPQLGQLYAMPGTFRASTEANGTVEIPGSLFALLGGVHVCGGWGGDGEDGGGGVGWGGVGLFDQY